MFIKLLLNVYLVFVNYLRFLDGLNFQGAAYCAGQIEKSSSQYTESQTLVQKCRIYFALCHVPND